MKTPLLGYVTVSVCILAMPNQSVGGDIPGLFATGVLDNGWPAPDRSNDLHYTFVAQPWGTPIPQIIGLAGCSETSWTNGSHSKWIGPTADPCPTTPTGNYVYRTAFDLTGFVAETARIQGMWCADAHDTGRISLNGTQVVEEATFPDPGVVIPFSITNGFASGTNFLDFTIEHPWFGGGTPTALRVEISGTAYNPNDPPDLAIRVSEVELCWPATTGKTYQVQFRSDATTNFWVNLGETIPGTNGFVCLRDAVSTVQRFYRLQLVP